MKIKIAKISPDVQIKSILTHTAWSDYHYLPVVNKAGKLLGTLPHKTVIKASQETNTTADNEIQQTGGALGELYSIGLTGLLKSLGKQ
jgi:CBS-domain-containing membrane protein